MKNLPQKAYLVLSDISQDEMADLDFNDLGEVAWSDERIYPSDIEYEITPSKSSPIEKEPPK